MPEAGVPPGLVVWAIGEDETEGPRLAQRLGVPLRLGKDAPSDAEWILFYEEETLFLYCARFPELRPIHVDFLAGDFARRWRGASRNDILAKAVGLKKGTRTILDATCGFGYDAFFLATFPGVEVTACERNPVAAELVMDALLRVKEMGRFEEFPLFFHLGDARDFLRHRFAGDYDCIYLDPMYPREESRSAKQKKEMRIYRELVGKDPDAGELFETAWARARKRVVVKRPDDAGRIVAGREPDFVVEGKTVRYDVYLK